MKTIKLLIIHLLDKFDNYILRHRFYWFCQMVGLSKWWGEDDCPCKYCSKIRAECKEYSDEQS
jgi:hypothetical protein